MFDDPNLLISSSFKSDILPNSDGIVPFSWFLSRSNSTIFVRFPNSVGIVPVRRLPSISSLFIFVSNPISLGIGPERPLLSDRQRVATKQVDEKQIKTKKHWR